MLICHGKLMITSWRLSCRYFNKNLLMPRVIKYSQSKDTTVFKLGKADTCLE